MSALSALLVRDLRPLLAVRSSASRRVRRLPVNGATLHYNGPALPFFPNPARELDFVVRVDVPEHQKRIGADSLQYHFVVLSNGEIWQTRDLNLVAWHCGNTTGNEQSIAIHLPLGVGQQPTGVQWRAVGALLDALRADYGFGRDAVVGHNEWPRTNGAARPSPVYRVMPSQSECPGPLVHRLIAEYRAATDKPATETWVAIWRCPIRQAPRVTFEDGGAVPIAGWLNPGQEFEVDLVKTDGDAQEVRGDRRWLHLANGLGFVWLPNCRKKE